MIESMHVGMIACYIGRMTSLLILAKFVAHQDGKRIKHNGESKSKNGKKIPYKILRYFPLKTRLQRLFMSSKTSPLMRWHHENKANDGIMRHPVDSKAWKKFDELHQSFAVEPRNVRL